MYALNPRVRYVSVFQNWLKPAGVDAPVPWRICLKWRVSTLAGFEGATKAYLNTISPWGVRDRVLTALCPLQEADALGDGIEVAPGL
ncbi:DUF4921 family protein [Micrococcus porci]|uniref:DUF4921 family protein n=1 Tax=Micrococcus porci TaxID=2856555 RepID=UPI003CF39733